MVNWKKKLGEIIFYFYFAQTINVPFEKKTKENGIDYNEYKCDDVHDKIFRNVLKQAYNMFRLFHGSFEDAAAEQQSDASVPSKLIHQLAQFYSKYLLTIKLPNCDILDVFRSVQYLALDQFLFLRINNFIQMIESTFATIKHCIFLHNDRLVWSVFIFHRIFHFE